MSILSRLTAPQNSTTAPVITAEPASQSIFARMQAPEAPRAASNKKRPPQRFRTKNNTTARYIILDEALTHAHTEHAMPDGVNSFSKTYEVCIANDAICPLCGTSHQAVDVACLTVLDLTPYTSKKTGKVYPFTRKILAIKRQDLEVYTRLQSAHGTLRGLVVDGVRGSDQKSSVNGTPLVVMDGGKVFRLTEDQLISEFGSEPVVSDKDPSIVYKQKNEDTKVFDYASIFAKRSASELEAQYSLPPTTGSRRASAYEENTQVVTPTTTVHLRAQDAVTQALGASLQDLDDEIPF